MEKAIKYLLKTYGEVIVRQASYNANVTEVVYYCHAFSKSDITTYFGDMTFTIFCKNNKLEVTLMYQNESNN